MAIKIKKNGKIEQFTLHSTDVKVLDLEGKFKKKDLESVIREISDTEHIHIGEVDSSKDGIWIDDGEILDNSESNGVVERLKSFVNETIGELSSLTTSIKSNLVGAINELKGNVDQLSGTNLLINGDFQVWQRGTKFDFDKTGYSADRWFKARHTIQSIEKKPTGSLKVNISGATMNGSGIIQSIENSSKFIGKSLTLSVKYKSNVNLVARTASYDYNKSYAIITDSKPTNEWKVMSCTGIIDSVMNDIIRVEISCPDIQDGTFEIEWVKLEVGSKATPFVPRLYSEELALCQRYYRNYDVDLVASNFYGYAQDTTGLSITMNFDTPMRIAPTFTLKNNTIRRNSTGEILTLSSFSKNISPYGLATMYLIKANIPLVTGQTYSINGTFDAEIY